MTANCFSYPYINLNALMVLNQIHTSMLISRHNVGFDPAQSTASSIVKRMLNSSPSAGWVDRRSSMLKSHCVMSGLPPITDMGEMGWHDGSYWHVAPFRCAAKIGRYRSNSGHWSALALNASVANDPKQSSEPHDFRSVPIGGKVLSVFMTPSPNFRERGSYFESGFVKDRPING